MENGENGRRGGFRLVLAALVCTCALGAAWGLEAPDVRGNVWGYADVADGVRLTRLVSAASDELEVPASLDGRDVVMIASYACRNCTNLTAVTVPPTLTSVGMGAFRGCSGLERVVVEGTDTKIPSSAFARCPNILSATVPGTLTMRKMFPEAYATIRDVTVSEGLAALPNGMFKGCAALRTAILPSTLTKIGSDAFKGCASLTELTVPASVEKAGSGMFRGCTALRALTFLGDCPKGNPGFKDLPADFSLRVLAGGENWPLNGKWCGRPYTIVLDPDASYEVPVVSDGAVVGGLVASRALTLSGCVLDGAGQVTRGVTVKIGKAGPKGSKIAASVIGVDGARLNANAVTADLSSGPTALELSLRTSEKLRLVIGADAAGEPVFTGSFGAFALTSASVGGAVTKAATFSLPGGFAETLQAGVVQQDFLPTAEPVEMAEGKWSCAGAASVAYRKDRATGAYDWVVNGGRDDPAKGNLSGLKLTYSADKGQFKGSFKVYTLLNDVLRRKTVTVTGIVVDGVGYGQAREKTLGVWPVRVE